MNLNLLLTLLKQSVSLLYERDSFLVKNDVHEQTISHHIAKYWENILTLHPWYIRNGYSIDVEYNRNLGDSKRAYLNCYSCRKYNCFVDVQRNTHNAISKPDIVLHKRGKNNTHSKEYNNLVVVEIKKNCPQNNEDFSKLSAFTCLKGEYKYHLGIYINLTNEFENVEYICFRNNKQISRITSKKLE